MIEIVVALSVFAFVLAAALYAQRADDGHEKGEGPVTGGDQGRPRPFDWETDFQWDWEVRRERQ